MSVSAEKQPRKSPRNSPRGGPSAEEKQARALALLGAAAAVMDCDGLAAALAEAKQEGVAEDDEKLVAAEELLGKLGEEASLLELLGKQREVLAEDPEAPGALRALTNLIKQVGKMADAGEEVEKARSAVRACASRRARQTTTGRMLEDIEGLEGELASKDHDDLFKFDGMKDPTEWKGHSAGGWTGWFRRGAGGEEVMLRHHSEELKGPLTKLVKKEEEAVALEAYRNILGWMGDKLVLEVQRASLPTKIAAAAAKSPELGDEIYVQLMKQLTGNGSARSRTRGWLLMSALCQQTCPSRDLYEYVRTFMLRALAGGSSDRRQVNVTIRQCIADLNITTSPKVLIAQQLTALQVTLIDFSTRRVLVPEDATLQEVSNSLAKQLKLENPGEFACFMFIEAMNSHRPMPSNTVLSTLLSKWKQLEERTGKSYKIMFKRKMMRKDQRLQTGNYINARLTYLQAVSEYLDYPVEEDMRLFHRIAATLLWVDRDYFAPFLSTGLQQRGVMEQLLPEICWETKSASGEAKLVTEAYDSLARGLDPAEDDVAGMSRAFQEMQKLRMFGGYIWHTKEVESLPEGMPPAIKDVPPKVCVINPKGQLANYQLCVSWGGIRFVAKGGDEAVFDQSFAFDKESHERVISWGANREFVQFVVYCVDPAKPLDGCVPMKITLQCTAAIDVVFVCHMIFSAREGGSAD